MKLTEDVTFDSLGAVRQELNEWLGDHPSAKLAHSERNASRDLLVSVLIHQLADELTNVRVRALIHAALSELQPGKARRLGR